MWYSFDTLLHLTFLLDYIVERKCFVCWQNHKFHLWCLRYLNMKQQKKLDQNSHLRGLQACKQ